jgi:hypothetical protein
MKNLLVLIYLMSITGLFAQDYVMFETHYLTPKPGHELALMEEVKEHNRLFHAEGPYTNNVFRILNGERTGDLLFAMGPMTFTQNDDRPSSAKHGADWNSVMMHAYPVSNVEYWVRNDDLSYVPTNADETPMDMSRVRFFDVADNDLFRKVQKQIIETMKAMGSTKPRTMYRKRFMHRTDRDWATVMPYKNWAELDEDSGNNFREAFVKVHGEGSWEKFDEDFNNAVISREDQWRSRVKNDD